MADKLPPVERPKHPRHDGPSEHESDHVERPGAEDPEDGQAYERAQPDSQPVTSSEPEPDADPANAG